MQLETKLPKVGTTIFSVMSQLAVEHKAVNLGQGFPDFEPPEPLREAITRAMAEGKNQYAPGVGIAKLREQIALKTERLYGHRVSPDTEVTVTSGATEALFSAIAAVVRAGDEVIVFDPCYDSYEPAIELQGATAVHLPLTLPAFAIDWQRRSSLNSGSVADVSATPVGPARGGSGARFISIAVIVMAMAMKMTAPMRARSLLSMTISRGTCGRCPADSRWTA